MRRHRCTLLAAALALFAAAPAAAQLNPSRTITVVVPIAAGGGVDAIGRLLAEKLQERLKQNVVVENRTGAGGTVGTDSVAKAAPDGHTLLLMESSATISKWLNKGVPFDVNTDFAPVARAVTTPLMLFAHPSVAANNPKELIADARTKPYSVATPGVGTPHHLAMLMMNAGAKIEITHVPYRGTGPGLNDLLGGQIPLMWATPIAVMPHVATGKVKTIGIASLKASPSYPNVPSIAESALPGFDVEIFYGVAAPKGTSPETVARLSKEIEAILDLPDAKERMAKLGFERAFAGSEQFRKIIADDTARFGRVVQAAGIEAK